jgi:apoptosis-inducing factor 3
MPESVCDVGAASNFPEGEMREVEALGQKILIIHQNEHWYAVGAQCPHYGVSLAGGLLCGHRIVCPWHKSVFRITDGALLDLPALDGLQRYSIDVRNERVFITISDQKTPVPSVAQANGTDDRVFVLAGAGAAGAVAADELRQLGFNGHIVLLSAEPEAAYDRTKLSKEFLSGNATADDLPLRPPAFWEERKVERKTQKLSRVDTEKRQLTLSDGSQMNYDQLLLATGSVPKMLHVPGDDLGGIFTLRSQADAQALATAAQPGVRIVVIGSSFIATEVASCFAIRKLPVTVIVSEKTPFTKQLGAEVGQILQQWHEMHGVLFRLEAEVERFEGTGVVRHVLLKSGERLPADVVVVGIGVQPATDWAETLTRREDGGLIVDAHLQAAENVFAAGDIAVFPESYTGQPARIEHWRVAEQQGRLAAANFLGQQRSYEGVPYFWTNHFGTRFDYIGHAKEWDEVILQRGEELPAFLAFYIKGDRLVAASACQHDLEIAAIHELMRQRRVPSAEQIRAGVDLPKLAKEGAAAE